MKTPDCTALRPLYYTSPPPKEPKNVKRNAFIGTSLGILSAAMLLTKGNLKNLPKIDYGIKEVMTVCTGSAFGGWLGVSLTTKENSRGRTLELKNQLLYNDFIPLLLLKGADMLCKVKDKFIRSIVLVASLLGATYLGHYLCELELKKRGLKTNYPVKACHLIADFDDFLLPIAIATKSVKLQQFLKTISPITFAPLGVDVGTTKDSKYYETQGFNFSAYV